MDYFGIKSELLSYRKDLGMALENATDPDFTRARLLQGQIQGIDAALQIIDDCIQENESCNDEI